MDSTGKVLWGLFFETMHGNINQFVMRSSYLYVQGFFSNNMTIGKVKYTTTYSAVFIAKIDLTGTVKWLTSLNSTSSKDYIRFKNFVVDANENISVLGTFTQNMQVGSTTLKPMNTSCVSCYQYFIAKLNGSGQFVSATLVGAINSAYRLKLLINSKGNFYIIGSFNALFEAFLNSGIKQFTGSGKRDILVAKTNNKGELLWVTTTNNNPATTITEMSDVSMFNDKIYIVGYFDNSSTIGTTKLVSKGGKDLFIWQNLK
jgi:hypothetical protein